jgi:hypothetical protein
MMVMLKLKQRFVLIILFICGLLFALVLGWQKLNLSAPNSWQLAVDYLPKSVLEKIIKEHSRLDIERSLAKVRVREISKQPQLLLLDFNNEQFCGKIGCVYTIYQEQDGLYKEVLSRYLDPNLPSGISLVELGEKAAWETDLPCLIINQMESRMRGNLRKTTLCYNQGKYQKISQSLVNISVD